MQAKEVMSGTFHEFRAGRDLHFLLNKFFAAESILAEKFFFLFFFSGGIVIRAIQICIGRLDGCTNMAPHNGKEKKGSAKFHIWWELFNAWT